MKIKKTVEEGAEVPRGYGFAWREYFPYQGTVCYPLGLNKLAGWARRLHHWLISIPRESIRDQAWYAGYKEGCFQKESTIVKIRGQAHLDGWDAAQKQMLEERREEE